MQTNVKPPSPMLAHQTATIETTITNATEKHTQNAHFSPAKAMAVSVEAEPARAKATPVSRERFPMPAGYGAAWLGFNPTHRATYQRPGDAGVKGAGGSGGVKSCGVV